MIIQQNQSIRRLYAFAGAIVAGTLSWITPAGADTAAVYLDKLKAVPALTQDNLSSAPSLQGTSYSHAITGPETPGADQTGPVDWRITYNLKGDYVRFRTFAGVSDMQGAKPAADFLVQGDGKTLFSSANPQRSGDAPINLDLDVTGVQTLTLEVTNDSSDPFPKTVVWADPELYAAGGTIPDPPQWPPVQTNQSDESVSSTDNTDTATPSAPAMPNDDSNSPSAQAPPNSSQPMGTPDEPAPAPPVAGLDNSTVLVIPLDGRFQGFPHIASDLTGEIGNQLGTVQDLNVVPADEGGTRLDGAVGYLSPSEIRQAGRAAGARYVVMGRLTVCEIDDKDLNIYVASGVNTQAVIEFDAELADAATGRILKRDTERVTAKTVHIKGFDFGADDDMLINDALQYAARRFADAVSPVLLSGQDQSSI